MKFSERVAAAMQILRGTKTLAAMVPTWSDERPVYSEVYFENIIRNGYRKNELIFGCVNKTANTAAQVELKVYSKREDEELEEHPLKALIQRPNPFMSEFDFWSAVIIYQKLAGRAIFEKVRSRAGKVVELWPLRPDWVTPIARSGVGIGGWEYAPPGIDKVTLKTEDVVDFKLFDPLNMYQGWPPAAVAARVCDVDNAATDYIKLFFQKGGTPPGLLKTVKVLTDAQVEDIRRRWRQRYGGMEHWLEPAVLDNDAEYQKIGASFTEMGFETLDARDEARICMVMDIPPILVGAKIGLDRATYSNYAEARSAWWEDSLIPQYTNFLDVVINQLGPEFGGDFYAEWDFSKVKALQEEVNKRWARATEALKAGSITVNEFCAEVGLPGKGPAGDVYLRGMATVEVPLKTGTRPASETGEKSLKRAADDDERRKHEQIIEKAMTKYLSGQLTRIASEVSGNGR